MKWLIASDIHGSAQDCRALLRAFEEEKADRILLLGDLLYHGPRNRLPESYDPKEVISLLNAHKNDILCVRGNCDTEVDQMVLEFPIMADYAIIADGERMIFATHGHHWNEKTMPPLKKGDILLHGHTHISQCLVTGANVIMNPGSASIPKGGTEKGYMTMENGVYTWKNLKGETLFVYPG